MFLLAAVYFLVWFVPPLIMCGSWQYGPVGGWLLLFYWVIALINIHWHVREEALPGDFRKQQYVICAAVVAQALGMAWSWIGADPNIHFTGDFALFGPTAAGVGACAAAAISSVGYLLVIAWLRIASLLGSSIRRFAQRETSNATS